MLDILINVSKYFFVLCAFYFFYASIKLYLAQKRDLWADIVFYYNAQRVVILCSHFVGFIVLTLTSARRLDIMILYLEQALFFLIIWFFIGKIYKKSCLLIWNLVLFLLHISFLILTRLDYGVGVRQFRMAILGLVIALIIPKVFQKINFISKLHWIYIIIAFALLFVVNDTINGAKNWLTIGTFSFQPSELVKIMYILWLASFIRKEFDRKKLIISAIITGMLVMILVYQRDLGGALIFYVLFITILYLETNYPLYFIGGLFAGSLAALVGYKLFSHVRVRVEAFMNPWSNIDTNGYQIAQSLFAIGAGGWAGTGLTKGLPEKIPVVTTDFIFSAISEELGAINALFIIGLFIVFFIVAIQIAMDTKDHFIFIMVSGISIIIAFQAFLIIGGVTKVVPSTGVTLPFISYGGTSLIASCILVGLLQGAYLRNSLQIEGEQNEENEE